MYFIFNADYVSDSDIQEWVKCEQDRAKTAIGKKKTSGNVLKVKLFLATMLGNLWEQSNQNHTQGRKRIIPHF